MRRLEALDPILGALDANGAGFVEQSLEWQPGDLLVMYTDGITEARNAGGRMFDHVALEACIVEHSEGSAECIEEQILAAVSAHAGDSRQGDDLTLVVVRAR
jgi:sigma-B regulation protein RsbU (phosphoserine phosphatase)